MVCYEDVQYLTTEEYFGGNKFSIDAVEKKYALENESYVNALKRVCDYIASVEDTEEKQRYWSERWFDEIYNDWWHPAGSIMQGAGSGRNISLMNCTTISFGKLDQTNWDNLESIFKNVTYTVAKCAAYRQGLGLDFSTLRPSKAVIKNSSNESQGAVHWMKLIDSLGYYVGQKGRIPAMLFSLSCKHPDLLEFIGIKKDYTKIQNANISVQCTDSFYEHAIEDQDWDLTFTIPSIKVGDRIYLDCHSIDMDCQFDKEKKKWYYIAARSREKEIIKKTVRAKTVLELIAKSMFQSAEPGIQNIDIARKYSNSDHCYDSEDEYDSRILSTNACSEQYLSRESMCDLGSLNMGKFSIDPVIFKEELKLIAPSINRFLDNVNEAELRYRTYATPHQRLAIEKLRRTGAGFTNMCAWLFKQNLEYGSKEANETVEEFQKTYNYYLYDSSIKLGKEKGSFKLFDREKIEKSPFIKRMMKLGLVFDTLRNVTVSSIAPTGTLSLMFRDAIASYGVEAMFGLYYWKRTRIAGKYEYYFCVPRVVRDFFKEKGIELPIKSDTIKDTWDGKHGKLVVEIIDKYKNKLGINFKQDTEISPFDKLDLMSRLMKWCDSSISTTYALPENSNWKDVYNFLIEGWKKEVKSIAAFPNRRMYGIVSNEPFKELAQRLIKDGIVIHAQNFSQNELLELNLTNKQAQINHAEKRPKDLACDVYHITVEGKQYFCVMGKLNGNLYECFCGKNNLGVDWIKNGVIRKIKRGHYQLLDHDDNICVENLTDHCDNEQEALARMISLSMRHHVNLNYILLQLETVKGHLNGFAKSVARVLKKYVDEGSHITGQKCPQCSLDTLYRISGCWQCQYCSFGKCN